VKLTVVIPIISDAFNDHVHNEVSAWVAPGTEVEIRRIAKGTASIESEYDEALAGPGILAEVAAAAADGADAVFITCFGDPAVHAAREFVDIPVVGGFEPAMLTALSLGERVGIVTVLPNVLPMLGSLIRRYGMTDRVGPIRVVDIPVLSLDEPDLLLKRLTTQASEAVANREADVIVLGCTGMIGVAADLQRQVEADRNGFVPVVDPTGAAVLWLESMVRLGVRPSRTTYMPPPPKDRVV
jgi:allantoin racemase